MLEGPPTDLVHEEGPIEVRLFGQYAASHLRVLHSAHPFGQWEMSELVAVGGPVLKGIELRLEAQQHPEASVADLGSKLGSPLVGPAGCLEPGTPAPDLGPLHGQEGDGTTAGLPQAHEPLQLGLHGTLDIARHLTADPGRNHLEDAGTDFVHG